MKIIVAESAGFCFGVRRAVAMCEEAADKYPGCLTLGPIIHNDHVIHELSMKGVLTIPDISDIPHGSTVVVRCHGAGKSDFDALASKGVNIIDATCPEVKRIHDIAQSESAGGRTVVIIGQRHHPEVVAIAGWCDRFEVFETLEELSQWLCQDNNAQKPLSLVSQTTNIDTVYNSCVELVKKLCTNHRIFDTICLATCKRQHEAEQISKIADHMIVIGGKNSANSHKLAEICKEHCAEVIFAESADELISVDTHGTVGITAGASTPAWIIKEVVSKMSEENRLEDSQLEPEELKTPAESECTVQEDVSVIQEEQVVKHDVQNVVEEIKPLQPVSEDSPAITEESQTLLPVDTEQEPVLTTSESTASEEDSAVDNNANDSIPAVSVPETFEEMLEKSIKTLHTGEKVTGVITSITATEVSVELGTKQSGYIPISEFIDDSNGNIEDIIKIGDTIETFVMRVNDVEGMVMLSKKRLDAIKNWNDIDAAKENKTIVEGVVTEENKGGVVVNVKGVRVFIPASQTGLPKSSPMTELLKKTVKLRITEVNQSRRRVVGSIRAVQIDQRREKSDQLWNEIEVGKQYDGVVKSMTSYGVFVDIGGVDGMIHISELSWTRIKQPSEVLSVGDEVSVYVLSYDKDKRKISLGYKKHEDNPWTKFTTQNAVGDVVNVKIVKMMPFGAFAEICPGVDGLIHISQITDHRIGLPSEVLSDGQLVDVKITEIDNDRKKVSLSIRALISPSSQPLTEKEIAAAAKTDNTPVIVYDTDAPPEPETEVIEADTETAESTIPAEEEAEP